MIMFLQYFPKDKYKTNKVLENFSPNNDSTIFNTCFRLFATINYTSFRLFATIR